MIIDQQLIEYIANLSRLELTEQEQEQAKTDLTDILTYMDKLNTIDTTGIEPMSHILPIKNVFREDVLKPSTDRALLLQNAPDQKDGSYKVPKTVD